MQHATRHVANLFAFVSARILLISSAVSPGDATVESCSMEEGVCLLQRACACSSGREHVAAGVHGSATHTHKQAAQKPAHAAPLGACAART
jgi:hypothetical protein